MKIKATIKMFFCMKILLTLIKEIVSSWFNFREPKGFEKFDQISTSCQNNKIAKLVPLKLPRLMHLILKVSLVTLFDPAVDMKILHRFLRLQLTRRLFNVEFLKVKMFLHLQKCNQNRERNLT